MQIQLHYLFNLHCVIHWLCSVIRRMYFFVHLDYIIDYLFHTHIYIYIYLFELFMFCFFFHFPSKFINAYTYIWVTYMPKLQSHCIHCKFNLSPCNYNWFVHSETLDVRFPGFKPAHQLVPRVKERTVQSDRCVAVLLSLRCTVPDVAGCRILCTTRRFRSTHDHILRRESWLQDLALFHAFSRHLSWGNVDQSAV